MEYNYFYKITNIVNNKFYYGVHKTNNLNDSYLGSGVALGRAKKKYGVENFKREILLLFNNYEECLAYEALIVDEYMVSNPMCYNMRLGGVGGCMKGKIVSEETKQKLSASNKGKNKGKVASEETKQKMSASFKGRITSEETKQKMSVAAKGRIVSEETKQKLSASWKGRIVSEETKAKIGAASKARIRSAESKQKLRDTWKKRKLEIL